MMLFKKSLILFGIGGFLYYFIEYLWRGYSHWTMVIVGGLCFLLIGLINEDLTWDMSIIRQMAVSTLLVTLVELVSGVLINEVFKLDVWDYSNMPFNFLGQICLPYCVLWFFLSALAIVLDDYLRYWLFNEEKPHYFILRKG